MVLDLGQQWAAETSLVGLEQLRHILHILNQMLQAPGKLFFFYVSLAISQDYFCVLGPTVYQQNITLQHTNIKKSVIPLT